MTLELKDRLEKINDEIELKGDTAPDLLNIAIWVVETVKKHGIASGYYEDWHIQALDTTSTLLRNARLLT